jgi:hypothetical protein
LRNLGDALGTAGRLGDATAGDFRDAVAVGVLAGTSTTGLLRDVITLLRDVAVTGVRWDANGAGLWGDGVATTISPSITSQLAQGYMNGTGQIGFAMKCNPF